MKKLRVPGRIFSTLAPPASLHYSLVWQRTLKLTLRNAKARDTSHQEIENYNILGKRSYKNDSMDNEGPRKKRKLNTSTSSPISAIAARKLRNQQAIATPITRLPNHPQFQTSVPDQIVDEHQNGAKVVSDSDSIEGVEVEDSGFE